MQGLWLTAGTLLLAGIANESGRGKLIGSVTQRQMAVSRDRSYGVIEAIERLRLAWTGKVLVRLWCCYCELIVYIRTDCSLQDPQGPVTRCELKTLEPESLNVDEFDQDNL